MITAKPFTIPKQLVYEAFKSVKANAGSAGVDKETIESFEANLKNNLYRIWNRMSSGTYFPPPVKAVAIPKKNGGERVLGVPTVADRVAQTTVKMLLEPKLESIFLPDSFGYRPEKSALDAIRVTRMRCWQYDWILEFDIRGLFDNIDHTLLMRAVEKHEECKWVRLYLRRWLTAPMLLADGTLVERSKGTPQGGVVSPVLANIFLHYAFDVWMTRMFPNSPWCRYADDGLVHCKTEAEALAIKAALADRLAECCLEMHPEKTQIVYCKDANRRESRPNKQFEFLGYAFRPRKVMNMKSNRLFVSFTAAVSSTSLKAMRSKLRKLKFSKRTDLSLKEISQQLNPILRGWIAYYGAFFPSALYPLYRQVNKMLVLWTLRKFKRFKDRKTRASLFIQKIAQEQPHLFIHWKNETVGGFV